MNTKDKTQFSIGAKLIIIISFIVIISLGSITALVSWLVQQDLRVSAEANNFEMNRRSAMEAESLLINMRAFSRVFLQNIASNSSQDNIRHSTDFFFSENPQLAAVFSIIPGGEKQFFANSQFFLSREMDEGLAGSFFNEQRAALGRAARGETVLVNAAPYFSRAVLALFYSYQSSSSNGGGTVSGGIGGVLFSSEDLNNNFGFGINKSYMLNSEGDILSHADFSLVREAENISSMEFIRSILDSEERNRQQLIETDFGVLQSASFENKGICSTILADIKQRLFAGKAAGSAEQADISGEPAIADNSGGGKTARQFVAFTKLNTAGAVVITGIEYDKVFEGIAATTRRNIYLTIAVLSFSVIFIWFFSKSISIPLKSLAGAAQQIEGGVFEVELKSKSNDEIGVLASGFRKMCSALRVFGRFTNREIAVKAMRGEIKPGGLPKHGTIFFSDIRGFTAKCEDFTKHFGADASDKIVHWLNNYFTEMIDCVEKTNGVVDKFIGDAVMAHWGTAYTAGSPAEDAFNCIKAALMMRNSLYRMNRERKTEDPANPAIRIGCGINTGIVTAGQLGSDTRMEYTVIGDPVNLASRIETLTKPLGADILISEETWNLVGDKFITEEMPSVRVKGKEKPVRIFAIVNFAGSQKRPQNMEDLRFLLGIKAPNMATVDVNADEKKYKINES